MNTDITSYEFLPKKLPFQGCNYIVKDSSGRVFAYEHTPIYYSRVGNYDDKWGVGTGNIVYLGDYSPEKTCRHLRFKWDADKQLWKNYPDTTEKEPITNTPEKHTGIFVIELETNKSPTRHYFTGFDVLGNPEFDSDTKPFLRPVIFFQEAIAKKIASNIYSEIYTSYGVKVIRVEEMVNVNVN
jgi:hypothetical protein